MIELKGFSGCKIHLLYTNKGVPFIRKVSKNFEYNSRLQKQCQKQINYQSSYFFTPQVYNSGVTDNLFFFDMEYIQGTTVLNYMKRITLRECYTLADNFLQLIPQNNHYNEVAHSRFKNKIEELHEVIKDAEVINTYLLPLYQVDWGFIPESECHGDLTFENILIKNNKLYLIDFLDSFYNSWVLDIAKLFQDIQVQWGYRNELNLNVNLQLRLLLLRRLIFQRVSQYNFKESLYNLIVLNILRLIPYISQEQDMIFLKKKLKQICVK